MKKLLITTCMALMLCACAREKKTTNVIIVAPEAPQTEVTQKYASNYERLVTNVLVKDETPVSVTYEYKDVRIDEVALLADRYCQDRGLGQAMLIDAVLYKNFSRRASFHCTILQ